jgi:diphthamide synthase (EF-2-diphthine--ammonia ligase)
LWQCNTTRLVHEFIDLGFQAIIVCTKAELLDSSFIGRIIDHQFVKDLPPTVDPCGENGEFHSFVFNGPIFRQPVPFTIGEKVYRTYTAPNNNEQNMGFWFCDLFPASV